jgi:CheY-like chemotaxis protein
MRPAWRSREARLVGAGDFGIVFRMARPTNALIVDDEAHVRVFVKTLLKQAGIEQTWEASDGTQALAMVAKHSPELVMLDINLPMMSGIEVLAALQADRRELPVIMMSAQSSMKTVLECVKLGAVAYILKHSAKAEAFKLLSEALDRLADGEGEDGAGVGDATGGGG